EGSAGAAIPASPRGSVAVEEQATTVRTARVVVRRGEVDCGVGGAYTRCRVDLARRPGGYGPPGRAAFTGYLAIIGAGTHRELLSGGLAACRSIRSLIALRTSAERDWPASAARRVSRATIAAGTSAVSITFLLLVIVPLISTSRVKCLASACLR